MLRLIVLCGMLTALPIAAMAQTPSPPVTWTNDHARFVIQSVDPDGRLKGTYENGASIVCAGTVYPVTGWIDGNRIAYTVLRKDPRGCGALQTFVGVVRGDQLVVDYLDYFPDGTMRPGGDSYRRQ